MRPEKERIQECSLQQYSISYVKYDTQDQQGKAAVNECSPNTTLATINHAQSLYLR
jgi:hypothetical protein